MKRLFLITVALLFGLCFAEEFKGFLGIPFRTSKAKCLSIMESKGWNYNTYFSTYTLSVFDGRQYAGKDVISIIMQFRGDLLVSVSIQFKNGDEAKGIFDAIIEKYSPKNYGDFYSDGSNIFVLEHTTDVDALIDSYSIMLIDGTYTSESTMESDI